MPPEPTILSTQAPEPGSSRLPGPPPHKRAKQRHPALPLRSEPGEATRQALHLPELVSEVLDCLTERDLGWDPENILNASLVNSIWLEAARPIILREIAITPGLSTSTAPDTRLARLTTLVGQNAHARYVRNVYVQFSRNKMRARRAAPGRGPDPAQISALLYLTSWVRSLSITNLELADFMSTLQDPLRRLTTIQHVGLYFGHHNSFQSLPIASDIASRPSCIVDSVCDLLSCWPQLRSLALSRLINLGAGTVVAPEETCFVPELPRLMSLTLRECRLSNRQLAQMLEAAPALRRLYIHQPDLLVFKRAAFMESISTVQKQLETLHLSAISEAFAKDIVLTGWWPEVKDLAISAINLDRASIVENLPPNVQTLRIFNYGQKQITQTFVAKLKKRLHKGSALKVLKLPLPPCLAMMHRQGSELRQVCQDMGVQLEIGPETLAP